MSTVNPIKDKQVVEKMKEYLREKNTRSYLIFRIGINLGLSINELLYLRVDDIVGKEEFFSGDYCLRISDSLQKELAFYVGDRKDGYLFRMKKDKLLNRFQVYNALKDAADAVGFAETVGALTLRKTFAYWAYKDQKILSKYLNHHTISHTLRYIGIKKTDEVGGIYLTEMDL